MLCSLSLIFTPLYITGADPGFQVRGGALKKIAPSGGRCENVWGISCEKSRFYPKKIIFFPIESAPASSHRFYLLTNTSTVKLFDFQIL
jgi:hypothetical protein